MKNLINKVIQQLFSAKRVSDRDNSKMKNVVDSMFLCTPLYDRLKVICHPDRFVVPEQNVRAEELFQLLQKYRYDYEQLQKIEQQINDFISHC